MAAPAATHRRYAGSVIQPDLHTGTRHLEWADYDLLTHVLAALHLIIETDRLTGGHTREQIVDKLVALIAFEHPRDPAERHREIAEAAVDLLANARDRHTHLRDRYLRVGPDGSVSHPARSTQATRAPRDGFLLAISADRYKRDNSY